MSDFSRMMELAMKGNPAATKEALGEPEPKKDDKQPAAEQHPQPQTQGKR